MTKELSPEEFGCERCWPDSADAAWIARGTFAPESTIVDESHFHVMILSCPHCSHRFLSVFTETIDWQDGEDPQYWTLLPLTIAEATALAQNDGPPLDESVLNALGPGRKSLGHNCPKGKEPVSYWGIGLRIGHHD